MEEQSEREQTTIDNNIVSGFGSSDNSIGNTVPGSIK
tara:strand:- start:267 stop:377 length:111 start_codon:yes stop_codon:yes gene_type:complete